MKRVGVALLGLLPVAPLLAWSYGLGSFRAWFLATTVPALLALVAVAARATDLRPVLACGAAGGLLGTIGYDVFRVPFVVVGGLRLLAPIDSYGVLLLGARSSSGLSGFAGWAFHLANGVGFGIAYAAVMRGRNRWWGVVWGMVLETATVLTPFASIYGIRGKWHLIGIAYAAHVAYGLPLGYVVERRVALPAAKMLGAAAVALAVWLHPWSLPPSATTVRGDRMHPEWLRVRQGDCVEVLHRCFPKAGVIRVRLSDEPYSGGFVIVERRPRSG